MTDPEPQPTTSIFTNEREAGRTPTPHVGRPVEPEAPTPTPPADTQALPPADPAPQAPASAPSLTEPTPRNTPVLVAPPPTRTHWAVYVALAAIAALSLYLRLRDPLSTTVIGAEDPYLHMERTYQLANGHWVRDYPIGFMMVLAPFALMGPDVFYDVARFGPPVLGVVGVVLTFFLCRPYLHPAGSLTAALLIGVMPEHIRRTNLLFPTAIDLALLPFFFLVVMKLAEGRRWAVPTLLGLTLALLVIHPWVVALMLPPLLLFGAVEIVRRRERKAVIASGGVAGVVCAAGLFSMFRRWQPASIFNDQILPKMAAIAHDPALLLAMPQYVDLPWMLTWPAMLLAIVGVVLAAMRHTRFNILILFWSLLLVPLVVVDWFGVWYLPHRTVVYLSLGVAILGGVTVSEIARALQGTPAKTRIPVLAGAIVVIAAVMMPAAVSLAPWYRLYDHDDEQAWQALDERLTRILMSGSWEGRTGYRAMTGRDALYYPDFFSDDNRRAFELKTNPDMVVLLDQYAAKNNINRAFLDDGTWTLIGEWGDVSAYQHQA